MSSKILLVEDEKNIAAAVSFNLSKQGYEVVVESRGDEAINRLSKDAYDLIILDVMLPGKTGWEILSTLREQGLKTPVLMLTAVSELKDRVRGLQLGADDYLSKPFALEELLARCNALLRRAIWREPAPVSISLHYEGIELDLRELLLKKGRKSVALTLLEAKLIEIFFKNPGRTLPRSELLRNVWGMHEETQTRTLDNFILRFRQHLKLMGADADWVESVRGVGYRLGPSK